MLPWRANSRRLKTGPSPCKKTTHWFLSSSYTGCTTRDFQQRITPPSNCSRIGTMRMTVVVLEQATWSIFTFSATDMISQSSSFLLYLHSSCTWNQSIPVFLAVRKSAMPSRTSLWVPCSYVTWSIRIAIMQVHISGETEPHTTFPRLSLMESWVGTPIICIVIERLATTWTCVVITATKTTTRR